MNARSLEERMGILEKTVEPLRELPARVTKLDEQVVQLRTEMGSEFSAIRRDMATKQDLTKLATREDLTTLATKQELTKLATKEDLTTLATKQELTKLATKEELTKLATKEDLTTLATKQELTKLATKEDIADMATRTDLARLGRSLRAHGRRQTEQLRSEMRALGADLHNKMLVLHEAIIDRLKVLGEARARPRRKA